MCMLHLIRNILLMKSTTRFNSNTCIRPHYLGAGVLYSTWTVACIHIIILHYNIIQCPNILSKIQNSYVKTKAFLTKHSTRQCNSKHKHVNILEWRHRLVLFPKFSTEEWKSLARSLFYIYSLSQQPLGAELVGYRWYYSVTKTKRTLVFRNSSLPFNKAKTSKERNMHWHSYNN